MDPPLFVNFLLSVNASYPCFTKYVKRPSQHILHLYAVALHLPSKPILLGASLMSVADVIKELERLRKAVLKVSVCPSLYPPSLCAALTNS